MTVMPAKITARPDVSTALTTESGDNLTPQPMGVRPAAMATSTMGLDPLAQMALVTSMRLSVQPVTEAEWALLCKMGGV